MGLAVLIGLKLDVVYFICVWAGKGSKQSKRAGTNTLMGDLWKSWAVILQLWKEGCSFTW